MSPEETSSFRMGRLITSLASRRPVTSMNIKDSRSSKSTREPKILTPW
jgi:hypothetical protein